LHEHSEYFASALAAASLEALIFAFSLPAESSALPGEAAEKNMNTLTNMASASSAGFLRKSFFITGLLFVLLNDLCATRESASSRDKTEPGFQSGVELMPSKSSCQLISKKRAKQKTL